MPFAQAAISSDARSPNLLAAHIAIIPTGIVQRIKINENQFAAWLWKKVVKSCNNILENEICEWNRKKAEISSYLLLYKPNWLTLP